MSGLTKILIVLQLVFSLVLSVLLVLMVSKQENYKDQLNAADVSRVGLSATVANLTEQNAAQLATIADKERQLAQALSNQQAASVASSASAVKLNNDLQLRLSEIAQLRSQTASLTVTNQTGLQTIAEMRRELNSMQEKITQLIPQNAQLSRTNAEQETALRGADQAIRKLQEQLAAMASNASRPSAAAGATANNSSPLTLSVNNPINGQVTEVAQSAGRTYIETKLGTSDGVKENTRLAIYRGNTYVGDAVVTRATANASVAIVMTTKQGETVKAGDLVMGGE